MSDPIRVDTGFGVVTFGDNSFYGNVGGVNVNGSIDDMGNGSVHAAYDGFAESYYFQNGSLVGYPSGSGFGGGAYEEVHSNWGSPDYGSANGAYQNVGMEWSDYAERALGGGWERVESNWDAGDGRSGSDLGGGWERNDSAGDYWGHELGEYSGSGGSWPWSAGDGSSGWSSSGMDFGGRGDAGADAGGRLSTDSGWGVNHDGVHAEASASFDPGGSFTFEARAGIGFDWSRGELNAEVGVGVGGSDRYVNSFAAPEDRDMAQFSRDLLQMTDDQPRNVLENWGTNAGRFFSNAVENVRNLGDTITNFQDRLFGDISDDVSSL